MDNLIEGYSDSRGWWNKLPKQDKIYHLNNLKGAGGSPFNRNNPEGDQLTVRKKHLFFQDFSPSLQELIDTYYDILLDDYNVKGGGKIPRGMGGFREY